MAKKSMSMSDNKNLNDNTIVPFFNDSVKSCIGGTDNMSDALDNLVADIDETKNTKTEVKYKPKEHVQLTKEELTKLKLAEAVVKEYKPKIEKMKAFFRSEQWKGIVKKISANDDTSKYLLRNTKIAFGEAIRALEQAQEIVRKYS